MGCNPSKNSSVIAYDHQPQLDTANHNENSKTDITNQNQHHIDVLVTNQNTDYKHCQDTTINQNQDEEKLTNQTQEDKAVDYKTDNEDKSANQIQGNKMDAETGSLNNETIFEKTDENDNKSLNSESDSETKSETEEKNVKKVPLTEEEIEERKQKKIDEIKEMWQIFTDGTELKDAEGKYTKRFRSILFKTVQAYSALKLPVRPQNQYKREFNKLLAEMGGIEVMCDVIVCILKQGLIGEDGEVDIDLYKPLTNCLVTLTNFSDNKANRIDLMVNHPHFMEVVATELKERKDAHFSAEKKNLPKEENIIRWLLCITHNIAMCDEHIGKFRMLGYVPILVPYMDSAKSTIRLNSLAALADIVNEEESELLTADRKILKFLIKSLNQAIETRKRQFGWSTVELARTVRRIARNDANKRLLVEAEVLQSLVNLAKSASENYQTEAVGALWSLSFDAENQNVMISDEVNCPIDTFIRLKDSSFKEVRKICNSALWTMREKLAESEKYKEIGNLYLQPQSDTSGKPTVDSGHIMISYQWGSQEVVKSICESLRANGNRVWMDIDDMAGSTLDAMATAVEHADIVLVCYSQKYKDSDNCRAEAEYAFQKKKIIIPLKMERNYNPDGWLGFIIGAKLYFEFSGKYPFESKMSGLLKEVQTKREKGESTGPSNVPEKTKFVSSEKPQVAPVPSTVAGGSQLAAAARIAPYTQTSEEVKKWTPQQVAAWLTKHDIPTEKLGKLTGIEIAFLQLVIVEYPEFFYKTVTEKMQITDLLTVSKFRFALNDTTL